jgi:hypothetical protein
MRSSEFAEAIASAALVVSDGTPGPEDIWITPYSACRDTQLNQFVMFLKPDVTDGAGGVRVAAIVDALRELLSRHSIGIWATRVVSGRLLARTHLVERHYGVVNAISRRGMAALTEAAIAALHEHYRDELESGYEVLGGHQCLAEFPSLSPLALSTRFDSGGSRRLAAGTYACALTIDGKQVVLLNGFHPRQIERFTLDSAVTVLLEGRSTTAWRTLRREVAGATDPAMARPGSFRHALLVRATEWRVPEVSQNANGIHMSAGPLEGMVEVGRFLGGGTASGPQLESTCFGAAMREAGLSVDAIERLAENPILEVDGTTVSAFDLTEEMDAADAVSRLREVVEG